MGRNLGCNGRVTGIKWKGPPFKDVPESVPEFSN